MRVVVDPNVLVSSAVASGVSAALIDRWLTTRAFELVVCPALVGELREVLSREKFRRWLSDVEADLFIGRIEAEAESHVDPVEVPAVTGDPKDDYLVALFRAASADALVSGDSDLLAMRRHGIEVMTPAEMLEHLDAGTDDDQ